MKVTVAICTYNRADLLEYCLQSLTEQSVASTDFEVLVINNNSSDNTVEASQAFAASFSHFRIVTEKNQGLSYARNRAIKEAATNWILYLDDDAKADQHLLKQTISNIENLDFQAFGGVFFPWYHYGQPVWYKSRYASNEMKYQQLTVLKRNEYLSGGVFCMEKSLLQKYNGFDVNIGMRGDVVGYGEETVLQQTMRAEGVQLAYDPKMIIYHVVKKDRLSVDSFFKTNFAAGRDKVLANSIPTNLPFLFLVFIVAVALTIVDSIVNGLRLLLSKDYYMENWLIDSFRKTAKRIGIIYTALLQRYGNSDQT